jgi:hypothetical protein
MIRRIALILGATIILVTAMYGAVLADDAKSPSSTKSKDDEFAALKKRVEQQDRIIQAILADNQALKDRLDRLEGGKAAETAPAKPSEVAPGEPEVPPIALPGEIPGEHAGSSTAATPTARASLAPDIAVIGNNYGRFLSVRGDANRNRPLLGEIEIALEQPVYSGVKFHAQLAAGLDNDFGVNAEEAYISFADLAGLPLSGTLGKKRLEFGKVNPIHPHARSYVDDPAVITNMLGPDGLNGNGMTVNYLLPFKSVFANLQLGYVVPEESDVASQMGEEAPAYPLGVGATGELKTARLWISPELAKGSELELGASHGWGKDGNGDGTRLSGLDMTYKLHSSTFSKITLQSEAYWHQRKDNLGGTGLHTRSGYYALLNYAPTQYRDYGLRFDSSRYPWPIEGRDQSVSLIWSNHIAEATIMRLQYKYGDRTSNLVLPSKRGYSELYLQFIWGAGSHSHPLY